VVDVAEMYDMRAAGRLVVLKSTADDRISRKIDRLVVRIDAVDVLERLADLCDDLANLIAGQRRLLPHVKRLCPLEVAARTLQIGEDSGAVEQLEVRHPRIPSVAIGPARRSCDS
jgi:hypothetical protein